jgi:hypothetical protein
LDITGNGTIAALTDGLLIVRWLFGLQGAALTAGVVDPDCTRCDPTAITAYLQSIHSALDVDANGLIQPLSDGILILRRMFGLSGEPLISGAVAANCTRCDALAIASYIDSLMQ